jgi:hypothetical protein
MFNKRVLKLERVFRVLKDASDPMIIIKPILDGTTVVMVDGETLFTGTPEECDKWADKKYGPRETIMVGAPNRQ